jgi:hypothetical protein
METETEAKLQDLARLVLELKRDVRAVQARLDLHEEELRKLFDTEMTFVIEPHYWEEGDGD